MAVQNKDHISRLPLQPGVLLWFNSGQENISNNYWWRTILDYVYTGNNLGMTEQDRNLDPWPPGAAYVCICLMVMWVTNRTLPCLSHYYFGLLYGRYLYPNIPCKVFSSDWHIIKHAINKVFSSDWHIIKQLWWWCWWLWILPLLPLRRASNN